MAKAGEPGDPIGSDVELAKKERELLNKVTLKSFTATPASVPTFGTVTLAWDVTLPPNPLFDITITLNKAAVIPKSSTTKTLTQPTPFTLAAVTEHAGRTLKSITVAVQNTGCQTRVLEAFVIISILKHEFDARFTGSDKFSLRGDGTSVTLGQGTFGIHVPLTINVPDWFDADMDIDMQLALAPGKPLRVVVNQASVNVDWTFFENLLSLGCGSLVESGMEQIATAFLRNIAEVEVAPQIQKQLIDQVNSFLKSLNESDPAHREFATTALILTPAGFSVTACPKI